MVKRYGCVTRLRRSNCFFFRRYTRQEHVITRQRVTEQNRHVLETEIGVGYFPQTTLNTPLDHLRHSKTLPLLFIHSCGAMSYIWLSPEPSKLKKKRSNFEIPTKFYIAIKFNLHIVKSVFIGESFAFLLRVSPLFIIWSLSPNLTEYSVFHLPILG